MPKRWTAVLVLVASLFGFASVSAAGPGGVTARSPRILAAPRIAGLAITGQTLTAYRGTWSGRPTRYRFVWQRCSKSGATCRKAGRAHGARYRISGRDVGRRIRLVVTAWNRAGSKSARSKATPAVTKAGGPPTKSPPPVGGYFSLQPAGTWSRLPSGAECARLVHRSIWEPRPDNRKRNHIVPDANAVHRAFAARPLGSGGYDQRWDTWLLRRVDGQFTGTTDEIFQWGACKWGLSDDMLRAIADEESTWYQYLVYPSERCVSFYGCGDFFESSSPASKVFCDAIARYGHDYQRDYGSGLCPQTFSIVGIKSWQSPSWGRMPDNQNGSFPFARDSTAFGVDYIGSYLRGCYEGWIHWLREEGNYGSGDIWGCVGSWYSGDWHSSGAESYNNRVRSDLNRHTWLQREWPSNRPPCSAQYGCPRADGL